MLILPKLVLFEILEIIEELDKIILQFILKEKIIKGQTENFESKKEEWGQNLVQKDKQSSENDYAVEKQIQELIVTTYHIIQFECRATGKIINSINCIWTS